MAIFVTLKRVGKPTIDRTMATRSTDFNSSPSPIAADGFGNGQIDSGDYGVWRAHFGQTASGAGSGSAGASPLQATVARAKLFAIACARWYAADRGR
jgi:hypothetical protein